MGAGGAEEGGGSAGELEPKSRNGKHPRRQKEREDREAGRSSRCLAALKKPDADKEKPNRSAGLTPSANSEDSEGRQSCPLSSVRCQVFPKAAWGHRPHPGARSAGARGSLGELFPRRKSTTRDGGISHLSG